MSRAALLSDGIGFAPAGTERHAQAAGIFPPSGRRLDLEGQREHREEKAHDLAHSLALHLLLQEFLAEPIFEEARREAIIVKISESRCGEQVSRHRCISERDGEGREREREAKEET